MQNRQIGFKNERKNTQAAAAPQAPHDLGHTERAHPPAESAGPAPTAFTQSVAAATSEQELCACGQ